MSMMLTEVARPAGLLRELLGPTSQPVVMPRRPRPAPANDGWADVAWLDTPREEDPSRPLALLLGDDALKGLTSWHRWELLPTLAHFIVADRPGVGFDAQSLAEPLRTQYQRRLTTDGSRLARTLAGAIFRVPITPQPISATAIRAALARGAAGRDEIAGLLPAAVLAYIDRNQLYRSQTDAT